MLRPARAMLSAVRIASPCPTHSRTECAPRPPVSSRTRSMPASPRSLTTSVAPNVRELDAGTYVDLIEAGIIDPTKVVRLALENAVSVAGVLLLTEATMTEVPEPKPEREPVAADAGL